MELLEAIWGRRSVRSFLPHPVDRQDVLKMLDAARMAPSGGNLQPWHFIVVQDRDVIEEVAAIIRDRTDNPPEPLSGWREDKVSVLNFASRVSMFSLFLRGAPVLLAALYRQNPHAERFLKSMTDRGLGLYEAHCYAGFTEVQSVAAAIQNLLLTAHALDYGACWMNVPFVAKDDLKERLGVRPPWDLLALIPVGRPGPSTPFERSPRKHISEIVTFLGE